MLTLTKETLANAIKRAKKIRPSVKWLGGRSFTVSGSTGNTYNVHFAVARDAQGKQVCLGVCDCEAGKNEMACFHLAAASAVNIAIHAMRHAAQSASSAAATSPRLPDHEYHSAQDTPFSLPQHQHACPDCGASETCTDDCEPLADGQYKAARCVACLNLREAMAA